MVIQAAEEWVTRHALKAVLAFERELGPWDVKVGVYGYVSRVTELFHFGGTDVTFTVRGETFSYRLCEPDASDFRLKHVQTLMR